MDSRRGARWADQVARVAITSGGFAIILGVVAILLFVAREAAPLFFPTRGEGRVAARSIWPPVDLPLAAVADEYREQAVFVLPDGRLESRRLADGSLLETFGSTLPPGVRLQAADAPVDDRALAVSGSDGRVRVLELSFTAAPEGGGRRLVPAVRWFGEFPLGLPGTAVQALAYRRDGARVAVALAGEPRDGTCISSQGAGRVAETSRGAAPAPPAATSAPAARGCVWVRVEDADEGTLREDALAVESAPVTALAISGDAASLYAGTATGRIARWGLSVEDAPRLEEEHPAGVGGAPVSAMGVLTGGHSIIVAAAGEIALWSLTRSESHASGWTLTELHRLPPAPARVVTLSASARFRGFVAGDEDGTLTLFHSTTERRLLSLAGGGSPLRIVTMAPRSDGAVGVDGDGALRVWSLNAPHPEVTWHALFGKVWYEGYDRPRHVWQSTGSTDDFEPKLSLTPLIFGTLKGTAFGMAFALPIAVLAAVYTAMFADARTRAVVKPGVELMAGLPSVVVGFLAGLWMAPLLERHLAAGLLALLLLPALVLLAAGGWGLLPVQVRRRMPAGGEFAALVPILILGVWLAGRLGPLVEAWAFAGDLRGTLYQSLGLAYDQRNALVVGFAMAFAVIPIIFTISEDAIGGVPGRLLAGALALGASRWQAAIRVVLPTASPGIFSALMIGLGRAVGETMIVLMATGNTPILEWSPFNGLRTLSANIAVEMPEAPHGGTLYRVLFLAAALLFMMTFIFNTAAELVRMRLRERYARL